MLANLVCKYLGLLDTASGWVVFFGLPIFLLWLVVKITYIFGTLLKVFGLI